MTQAIAIFGRNFPVTNPIRDYVKAKIDAAIKFLDTNLIGAKVTLSKGKKCTEKHSAHFKAHIGAKDISVTGFGSDVYAAIDILKDKVMRLIESMHPKGKHVPKVGRDMNIDVRAKQVDKTKRPTKLVERRLFSGVPVRAERRNGPTLTSACKDGNERRVVPGIVLRFPCRRRSVSVESLIHQAISGAPRMLARA